MIFFFPPHSLTNWQQNIQHSPFTLKNRFANQKKKKGATQNRQTREIGAAENSLSSESHDDDDALIRIFNNSPREKRLRAACEKLKILPRFPIQSLDPRSTI